MRVDPLVPIYLWIAKRWSIAADLKSDGPARRDGVRDLCDPPFFGFEFEQHRCLPVEQERAGAAPVEPAIPM